jgi:hypothetical protein
MSELRPPTGRASLVARITLPACRVQYPGGPNRCSHRLLPCSRGLPRAKDGSASASTLSRPAQTLLALRPAGLLNRPRRPLSRGFSPADCSSKPLVSYQINRQLSGWNLPPLVIRALRGALLPPSLADRDRKLSLSVGRPGPHAFAVRTSAVRPHESARRCLRPSHPASRFVTIGRNAPLHRGGMAKEKA